MKGITLLKNEKTTQKYIARFSVFGIIFLIIFLKDFGGITFQSR